MTFSDRWPLAAPGDSFPFEGDEVFLAGAPSAPEPCVICRTPTRWFSVSLEGPYCGEECLRAMWDGYWEACRRTNDFAPSADESEVPF